MNVYNAAASVVEKVRSKHSGIRAALYALPIAHSLRPTVQALAQESLKHAEAIVSAAQATGLLDAVKAIDATERVDSARFKALPAFFPESLVIVLCYELLIGPLRKLKGAHFGSVALVRDAQTELQMFFNTSKDYPKTSAAIAKVRTKENKANSSLPRYIRVNTLKSTVDKAVKALQKNGFKPVVHPIIPELLVLPPGTNLHGHALVKSGVLFVQDLASCLPVAATPSIEQHKIAVDACAAPGNKTTQLAAKLALTHPKEASVIAFERVPARAKSLKNTVTKAGANDKINVVEADFLEMDRMDKRWAQATLAICDPSCSGSGNVSVGEDIPVHTTEELQAFADHQFAIVQKAMSLPNMQTVMYSTCSIHQIENEEVVARLLKEHGAEWSLVSILPDWSERGETCKNLAERLCKRCVRASHAQKTHGFFVSCFVKRHAENIVDASLKRKSACEVTSSSKKMKIKHTKKK
ncbi:tRNA and rRNA cytosine-C5-methylase [Thraustotheca clavata]|uniref:tRNA and rRNA cytosine-C5-methylase n=1 Tax=Thraustotheca clavata TaxID=74557 RepID=A0A1V9ZQG4_9STRA|nr:tRNA and rRNA cytosine-C5-methylase [Thraustotheca clavata]